jgi:DnaJ family protein C protein 2
MERNNEKLRVKRRKDEKARLARLVELAYAHDPRIRAGKQRQKDAKAAVKAERANALLRDREAAAAAEAAKQEAARLAAEKEMAEAAERKKQKERAAKALRKAKQRLRALATGVNATGVNAMGVNVTGGASPGSAAEGGSGGAPLCGEAHLELLCARLSAEAIEELCDAADKAPGQAGQLLRIAIEVEEASLAKETAVEQAAAAAARAGGAGAGSVTSGVGNHTQTPWTDEELTLLAKAANKFPGGLPDRWTLMAEFINRFAHPAHGRTADEVTNKVKEQCLLHKV